MMAVRVKFGNTTKLVGLGPISVLRPVKITGMALVDWRWMLSTLTH